MSEIFFFFADCNYVGHGPSRRAIEKLGTSVLKALLFVLIEFIILDKYGIWSWKYEGIL